MNPVFIFLIIIALVALWFLLSFLFVPLGKLTHRVYKDAVDEMNREDKTKDNTKEEDN